MSSVPDGKLVDDTPLRHLLDELMPEIGRRAGTEIRYEFMPRVRAFTELRLGHVELLPMATRTPERDAYAQLVVLGHMKASLMLRKSFSAHPETAEEVVASGMRVLIVRGQEFGPRFSELVAQLTNRGQLEAVGDQLTAVRMLKASRADAVIGLPAFFEPTLAVEGLQGQIEILDVDVADAIDEGLYVSKQVSAGCRIRLQAAGAAVRANGFYRALLSKYFPPEQRAAFLE